MRSPTGGFDALYNNRADIPCAVSISTAFLSNETNVSAPSHLPS